jgi:hypothetical protein
MEAFFVLLFCEMQEAARSVDKDDPIDFALVCYSAVDRAHLRIFAGRRSSTSSNLRNICIAHTHTHALCLCIYTNSEEVSSELLFIADKSRGKGE